MFEDETFEVEDRYWEDDLYQFNLSEADDYRDDFYDDEDDYLDTYEDDGWED